MCVSKMKKIHSILSPNEIVFLISKGQRSVGLGPMPRDLEGEPRGSLGILETDLRKDRRDRRLKAAVSGSEKEER
jgi:hypothetical protein